jgi:predicted RND superfamily exporter protein
MRATELAENRAEHVTGQAHSGRTPMLNIGLGRWHARLARAQVTRPWPFVLVCVGLALGCALLASRLELRTRFEELLPQARSSVRELKRLQQSTQAGSHISVVIEAGGRERQRAFGDALVTRLQQLKEPWLVDCADGVQQARAFLEPRAGMFAPLAELQRLHDEVEARWAWEVARQTGANLDDEPPPTLDFADVKKRLGVPEGEQFPDGYFQSTAAGALVVVAETSLTTGDVKAQRVALAEVKHQAEGLLYEPRFAGLRVSYAGDLVTGLEEYSAALNDLLDVGAVGLGLITLALFLFFLRVRALLALGATLAVGLLWTFGITYLTIGHLNVATGFLISIVAGNGINFGIIFVARVYEELRHKRSLPAAIESASLLTRRATLSAALVAGAAYGSLAISDFRAFKHFALIGGVGMLLCWLAAFLFLPSLLLVVESWRVGGGREAAPRAGYGERYGEPLAAAAGRWPRALALGGAALAVMGGFALRHYLRTDPLEYDMRRMQNDLGNSSEMYRASKIAERILGAARDGSMVMLAEKPEQARELSQALRARRDAVPADAKPFEAVHTVFDFVPEDQAEKRSLLLALRERLLKAHRRGFVNDADFARIEPYLPPTELAAWSAADLPGQLQRPFRDKTGQLGRLVLIEPTAGQSDSDVKYLMRWADSFREVPLSCGAVVRGSGRAVIFADILETVLHDIPRTVLASLGMTLLIVLATCRSRGRVTLVLGALGVGLGCVALAMNALSIKINFFNFVALPVSFGIGADYAVNFVMRYEEEPERGALPVLRSTGGAILLCSLTTTLGYLALLFSVNQAIRSLGLLAVLGEGCCLAAATLALPGYLVWRERAERPSLTDASLPSRPAHAAAIVAGDEP